MHVPQPRGGIPARRCHPVAVEAEGQRGNAIAVAAQTDRRALRRIDLPELYAIVITFYGQLLAVGAECQHNLPSTGCAQDGAWSRGRIDLPEPCALIAASREPAPIGAEGQRENHGL